MGETKQNGAVTKLTRILQTEARRHDDRAMVGGLAAFVPAWLSEAARAGMPDADAQAVAQSLLAYSALQDELARRAALAALLTKLAASPQAENVAAPTPAPTLATSPLLPARAPRPLPEPLPRNAPGQLGLAASVQLVNGIGPANAKLLAKLGVFTIDDLLHHYPVRYDDFSAMKSIGQLRFDESVTLLVRVASAFKKATTRGMVLVRVTVEDDSGMLNLTWFRDQRSADSMLRHLVPGESIVVSGKVGEFAGRLTIQNATYEFAEREWLTAGRIVPVYRLTEGLQPLLLRRVMKRVSDYWPQQVRDHLPGTIRNEMGLLTLPDALRQIHFPADAAGAERARKRLAFDELFIVQLAVQRQRQLWRGEPAPALNFDPARLTRLINALPYTLTGAQRRAVDKIVGELQVPVAMRRLLQGDVGSGKTVVAALAMALVASAGFQCALMAPTEILAEQHFKGLARLFVNFAENMALAPLKVRLLTGSTRPAEKRTAIEELASGATQIVIGTHALIQDGINFHRLGFAVVDEQHRFGVEQRKALRKKGADGHNPHTLFMTATPIPRTLQLTLYGDLDNTILDELPPGRQPIQTRWFNPTQRMAAYAAVRDEVRAGRQAFVICPLVEESDKIEAKSAIEEHARLQREVFPDLNLGLLHGRMKSKEKDAVMQAFARNEINVLVSTSVVEVGIDVPNATVMMIEGANRFGLSQLHQFRGRVGRGQHKSMCLLLADMASEVAEQRLNAIVATQDGFKLAEKDLEIRGPGEFFGTRQSGEPELKLVGIGDRDLLELARQQSEKLFARDPQLSLPEHAPLAARVDAFWQRKDASQTGDAS